MKVTVLMSSGDEDVWDAVEAADMDMDLGGALVITARVDEDEVQNVAVYAPGMWMKVEVDHDAIHAG